MNRRNTIASVLVFAVTGLIGGCGGGYSSPDEVFKAAKTSAEKEDWKGFCACLTDDSRDELAGGMVMMGMMMKAFSGLGGDDAKAKLKPVDEVMTKHGLTDEALKKLSGEKPATLDPDAMKKGMKKLAEPIKDKAAFVADMIGALKKGDGKKDAGFTANFKDAELKDVKIDGDTAKGVVASKQAGEKPIAFRKVSGSWKIDLPMDMPKG